jgi:P-type conjugative transfer protein TrbJ
MLVQSQIAQTVQTDSTKLATLVNASQGATGNLQVSQATNQLLALSIKQQLQIENLMAAQGRADALTEANNAEAEEEGRAAFQTFIGTSDVYTPE